MMEQKFASSSAVFSTSDIEILKRSDLMESAYVGPIQVKKSSSPIQFMDQKGFNTNRETTGTSN